MENIWLNKNNNSKLIVMFNGWAMNETAFKHLDFEDYDILIFQNYKNLNFDFDKFKYNEKYLICWSMGVFAVNKFKNIFNSFDKKIAINGTKKIIDNNFGIPEKIYDLTLKTLNKENLEKFIKNMSISEEFYKNLKISREIEDLKEELIAIQKTVLENEIDFNKAIISKRDKIVPFKNQLNFWKNQKDVEICLTDGGHYPFESYKNWSEIIC